MRLLVVALLLATVLAGCASSDGDDGPEVPDLRWQGVLRVITTPLEPFELQGDILATWDGDLFGLYVQNEDGMHHYYVRDGEAWYGSDEGRGWVRYDGRDALEASSPRSYRVLLWDFRALLEDADAIEVDGNGLTATVPVRYDGATDEVTLELTLLQGAPVGGRQTTGLDPESPYTIGRGAPMPFEVVVPMDSRTPQEVLDGDDDARAAHARVISWLRAYRQQTGTVPERVDEQSLAVQRLNQPWPTNTYDGTPLRDADASGHFTWVRCSNTDALYIGYGWDTSPIGESFGNGCTS